jgi:hypothetical protein
MHSAKRYLVIALSFAFCMTVFAAFAPRIAHAITATLVQVVNTYSNPAVIMRADDPGRSVVYLRFAGAINAGSTESFGNALNDASTNIPYTVPPGKRLVIDNASVEAPPPAGQGLLAWLDNGLTETFVPLVKQSSASGFDRYVSSGFYPRDYVESGQQYKFTMDRTDTVGSMGFFVFAVGHLVDCTNGGGC